MGLFTPIVIVYGAVSAAIAVVAVILAIRCFHKEHAGAAYLGAAFLASAAVDVSYYLSIITTNYFFTSVTSSIYFFCIDLMLSFLLGYVYFFTGRQPGHLFQALQRAVGLYALFDGLCLLVNPIREIEMHYVIRPGAEIGHYSYDRMPIYNMHLVFSYLLVAAIVILLVVQIVRVPCEYKNKYLFVILGILGIVAVNAVFLYIPGKYAIANLDLSICAYTLVSVLIYWTSFQYSTHGLLNRLKSVIFENIGQGLILFDYENELILANERARAMVPVVDYSHTVYLDDFLEKCQVPYKESSAERTHSVQCDIAGHIMRCDYKIIRNAAHEVVGRLFVFTNARLETDLLTGFENWENFRVFAREHRENFPYPTAVGVCDIDALGVVNTRFGREEGDKCLQELAERMRSLLPRGTYFVRGNDAHLLAFCYGMQEKEVLDLLAQLGPGVQYAAACNTQEDTDVTAAAARAEDALRNKKLLDEKSTHSELITSLTRALEECDKDTQQHVERTRRLGEALADRMGLTDMEKSQLSLLCLLHDIGKIAIPLEILNKPGKLDEEEWKIMRSHAEKGYEIAKSSKELSGIADMILHHHERWDGKGYPSGLSKESIPLLSRIISVVDSYDAMTNDRVYRKAMTQEEAVSELRRCAGTQFDPRIVSEFIEVLHSPGFVAPGASAAAGRTSGGNDHTDDGVQKAGNALIPAGTSMASTGQADQGQFSAAAWAADGSKDGTDSAVFQLPGTKVVIDDQLRILSVDHYFQTVTGYQTEEAEQMLFTDLLLPEEKTTFLVQLDTQSAKGLVCYLEHSLVQRDGTVIPVITIGRKFFEAATKEVRCELVMADLRRSHAMDAFQKRENNLRLDREARWEQQYRRDSLTGLEVHASFVSDVEKVLLQGGKKILLLMMDIDHFKEYNDTFGHPAGDELLRNMAGILSDSIRSSDYAGRMGGDEFALALVFDPAAEDGLLHRRAAELYKKISREAAALGPHEVPAGALFPGKVTISMGAAASTDGMSFDELYAAADHLLYQAKEKGRAQVSIGV